MKILKLFRKTFSTQNYSINKFKNASKVNVNVGNVFTEKMNEYNFAEVL
jgi:hypothetical protein